MVDAATVRLTVAKLSRGNPRDLRTVLRHAVHLCDLAQRDAMNAMRAGEADPELITRALDAAKHAALMVRAAVDVGERGCDMTVRSEVTGASCASGGPGVARR